MTGVLMMNGVHAEAAGTFQVQGAVVDEKASLRRALRDFEGDAENGLLGLARTNITRAKKNLKITAKIESFDAVLVKLQRLIIDSADKIFSGARDLIKNGSDIRVFLGLRKDKGGELLAREATLAIEERAVEGFIQTDLAGIE